MKKLGYLVLILSLATGASIAFAKAKPEPIEDVVEGTLHVAHGDSYTGVETSHDYYVHNKKTGNMHKIHLSGRDPLSEGFTPGDTVTIKGKHRTQKTAKDPLEFDATTLATAGGGSPPPTWGPQNFLVILVNLRDASVGVSVTQVSNIVFGADNVAGLYKEMSYGQTTFEGIVAPTPVKIAMSTSQGCQYYQWATAAETEIAKQGINANLYKHRVYVMPDLSAMCSNYWGYSTYGGNPSKSWIFKATVKDIYGHELGHALGAGHAGVPNGADYADTSDVMGYSGINLRHMNAPHKHQMGWVNAVDISASGTYEVSALESEGINVLRVYKGNTAEYYYISFRQSVGFDTTLRVAYANLVNIHTYKGTGTATTRFVQALNTGQSFTDATNHVTITVTEKTATGATLQIIK